MTVQLIKLTTKKEMYFTGITTEENK